MTLSALVIITNIAYTAAFDTQTRCPAWVDYELEPREIVKAGRASFAFRPVASVQYTDNSADYFGGEFDRGHMAPAADFNFDAAALRETYSFANVCPMARTLNRGPWRKVEEAVRRMAASSSVRVVTFPIFLGPTNRIGRVAVPDGFAKVAISPDGVSVWVMPNK